MQMTTQFCKEHWKMLKDQLADAGLGSLIEEGAREAHAKLVAQQVDGLSVDNFAPLGGAMMAITFNLFHTLGPSVMVVANGGCPLCAANAWHQVPGNCTKPDCTRPDAFDGWIGKAVQEQVDAWKALHE